MPKLKTHKGASKRFKKTGTGKVVRGHAYGRHIFPHGHSIYPALHVIAAQSPAVCPMAEFLLRPQAAKQALHANQAWPEGGSIALPAAAGLGVVLDEARIDTRRELT